MGDLVWKGAERRTAGAKALPLRLSMATAKPVPFVERVRLSLQKTALGRCGGRKSGYLARFSRDV